MIYGGDEIGNSQEETTMLTVGIIPLAGLTGRAAKCQYARLCKKAVALRKAHPVLHMRA